MDIVLAVCMLVEGDVSAKTVSVSLANCVQSPFW